MTTYPSEKTESLVTEGKRNLNYKVQVFENGEFAIAWQQWDYNLNKNKIGIKVFNQEFGLIRHYYINPDNISAENPAIYSYKDKYHVVWKSFINSVKREVFTSDFNLNERSSTILNVSGEDFKTADPLVTSFNDYIIYAYRAWNRSNSAYDIVFKIKDPKSEKNFSKAYKISGSKAGFDRIEFIKNGSQLLIKAEHGSLTEIIDISEFIPSALPTADLSTAPTASPTEVATPARTAPPTEVPTPAPSNTTTPAPTEVLTPAPSSLPSSVPSRVPSNFTSKEPSPAPTLNLTLEPSQKPTNSPYTPRTYPPMVPTLVPVPWPTIPPTINQIKTLNFSDNPIQSVHEEVIINSASAREPGNYTLIVNSHGIINIESNTQTIGRVKLVVEDKKSSVIRLPIEKSAPSLTDLYHPNNSVSTSFSKLLYISLDYVPKALTMANNNFNILTNNVPFELKDEEYPACKITHPKIPTLIITNNECEELGSFLSYLPESNKNNIPWEIIIPAAVGGLVFTSCMTYNFLNLNLFFYSQTEEGGASSSSVLPTSTESKEDEENILCLSINKVLHINHPEDLSQNRVYPTVSEESIIDDENIPFGIQDHFTFYQLSRYSYLDNDIENNLPRTPSDTPNDNEETSHYETDTFVMYLGNTMWDVVNWVGNQIQINL